MLHGTASDVRYVLRVLRRSPGFTLVAVLSLALGIGANAAMFGVVRALLLTPLPVAAPDELALLAWHREGPFSISQTGSTSYRDPDTGVALRSNFSHPLYTTLRESRPAGVDLFAFAFLRGVSVAVGDQPAFLAGGALVDGAYFSTLGVPMALGRHLTEADDRPGASLAVVLGHAFWMRAFGGDPGVLGRTVRVNGTPAEVVGVTAEGFGGLSLGGFFPRTEITVPLSAQPRVYPRISSDESAFAREDLFWLRLMARVSPGVSWTAAEAAIAATLAAHPSPLVGGDGHVPVLRLLPGSQGAQPVRPETARLLYLLLGVVAIVLLIACVNLAGLMLARGVGRQREMAVRRALGGGRGRLLRQALLESLALAAVGTAAGLVLAWVGGPLVGDLVTGSLGPGAIEHADLRPAFDPVVLGVTAAFGGLATLLFGLLPALRLLDLDPVAWLGDRGAGASGAPRLAIGRWLLALQIAVSVPLVVGAALFLRTASELGSIELGFDPEGLVTFQVDPGFAGVPEEEQARLYLELLARVREVPGVRAATLMENALMSGIVSNTTVEVDGTRHALYLNAVGPGFLETMGMRLLAGRVPGLQDTGDAPPVAAVNQTAVRELFGGRSPVGEVFRIGSREVRIVGVVNDTPYRSRREPVPATLHESALQRSGFGGHHLVLRVEGSVGGIEAAIRQAVHQVDPDVPVPGLRSQTALMELTTARERAFTRILTLFGAFALLLASIGLHGATSYAVARRTSEIGVRVAVGARPAQILWMVLRQVMTLAVLGLALGVPAALLAGPLVESLLYGVSPTSPGTVAGAAAVMLAVAATAGLLPALRAARLDPRTAMGRE